MEMNRALVRCVTAVMTLSLLAVGSWVHAQTGPARNGEAHATVPTVVRTDYDMRTFVAPLPLNETESAGRSLFAQRCANCHGATRQRPGPLLGKATVDRVGDSGVRDKVRKGSTMMPGFEYSLQPGQIDQIVAFLKTFTPRSQTSAPD
jgi:mono/diheme cytochrome c family protein